MRCSLLLLLPALLASTGLARAGESAAAGKGPAVGEMAVVSTGGAVSSDPVLSRLGLNPDQTNKIEKALAEHSARAAESLRAETDDGERAVRLRKLAEATRARVREALSDDQRGRFDAGMAVVAECQGRMLEAFRELTRASTEAKGDAEKLKAARGACAEKLRGIRAEQERLLDERVGAKASPSGKPPTPTEPPKTQELPPQPRALTRPGRSPCSA